MPKTTTTPSNKHGGKRPGPGRKPVTSSRVDAADISPLDFLENTMRDATVSVTLRVKAGMAAARYRHSPASVGKKARAADAASRLAGGKFGQAVPPKLVVNNQK